MERDEDIDDGNENETIYQASRQSKNLNDFGCRAFHGEQDNAFGNNKNVAAIARLRFDPEGNELFSGKIDIFPFVTIEPTKREGVNRAAGMLETKRITSDNARTHINYDDEEFRRAATEDGFDIRLMWQPPNSPDLNILDLGFFGAIQSL
ncbi:hypothetical protein KY285_023603 [Solanum tuberosum]|nr:hypothetical protein KY285_023603 [Solanum tuberosum]